MTGVDVVHTVPGSEAAAAAVIDAGAVLGFESTDAGPPPEYPVGFIDYPFTASGDPFPQHFAAVRDRQPQYAVAPDVEPPRRFEDVIRRADRLADFCETVIIPVKQAGDTDPSDVPRRFRVGLPFAPNFGSGGLSLGDAALDAYAGAPGGVHILGGSPSDQLRLKSRLDVRSLDTSLPLRYARKGRIWFVEGQVETGGYFGGLYKRLEASLRNIRRVWGATVEPTARLPDIYREFLRARPYPSEDRDAIASAALSGFRGAPPIISPESPPWLRYDFNRRREFTE
jgi:hypothetical protein